MGFGKCRVMCSGAMGAGSVGAPWGLGSVGLCVGAPWGAGSVGAPWGLGSVGLCVVAPWVRAPTVYGRYRRAIVGWFWGYVMGVVGYAGGC